ncbi:unnamed protein product [Paramecium sonneborni]|uniref:Uncharacterized protein n=1 Tax=Paramecium sonneborni TaxID=65129 RepID=A0A8S1RSN4_9CILI|nr:unnamed protein product [Paramecium sonneborni]
MASKISRFQPCLKQFTTQRNSIKQLRKQFTLYRAFEVEDKLSKSKSLDVNRRQIRDKIYVQRRIEKKYNCNKEYLKDLSYDLQLIKKIQHKLLLIKQQILKVFFIVEFSPIQQVNVVRLIKDRLNKITLAIGADDVNVTQAVWSWIIRK